MTSPMLYNQSSTCRTQSAKSTKVVTVIPASCLKRYYLSSNRGTVLKTRTCTPLSSNILQTKKKQYRTTVSNVLGRCVNSRQISLKFINLGNIMDSANYCKNILGPFQKLLEQSIVRKQLSVPQHYLAPTYKVRTNQD